MNAAEPSLAGAAGAPSSGAATWKYIQEAYAGWKPLPKLLLRAGLFLSPIGYRPEMVPPGFGWILYFNPIYYMTEMYRGTMLRGASWSWCHSAIGIRWVPSVIQISAIDAALGTTAKTARVRIQDCGTSASQPAK